MKYADLVAQWLVEDGYTHCFFVAGGNIMHLLDGMRSRVVCIPVVHEVAAGIAVEYFNESDGEGRAFALVTAGPGLTNIITAASGAWLESRELLILGGQVKSEDLLSNGLRQRGIQEIDGVALMAPVAKVSERIERPWNRADLLAAVRTGSQGRPGPVFLEFCLDAQGAPVDPSTLVGDPDSLAPVGPTTTDVEAGVEAGRGIAELMQTARRPVWLLGGGISRTTAAAVHDDLVRAGVPSMTTWNGADRLSRIDEVYVGRPNTWGQRSANLLLDCADLIVVFGSRLGLQQTGFNWQQWGRNAIVVQIDIDPAELAKGHPRVDHAICADANAALTATLDHPLPDVSDWLAHCRKVRSIVPTIDPANTTGDGYVSPFGFFEQLQDVATADDIVIPCSSGGANSVAMQVFEPVTGQIMITDKGLASMGYGLAGAIGASIAHPGRRTFLIEGDGGFTQNLQELATVAVNNLPIKIFIFANNGYGSIRTTQRNYFGGAYLGCDTETGLGFPEWETLFSSYGLESTRIDADWTTNDDVHRLLETDGPAAFIVPIDTEQTYWPKITSRVTESGSMESNPLHQMSPELAPDVLAQVLRFPR